LAKRLLRPSDTKSIQGDKRRESHDRTGSRNFSADCDQGSDVVIGVELDGGPYSLTPPSLGLVHQYPEASRSQTDISATYIHSPHRPLFQTKEVSETLAFISTTLTRLIARVDYSAFISRVSLTSRSYRL
jgi:hypothetical protein